MAREAVCSSTHQTNGMRPLYANKAGRALIGRLNSSVSIIPAREQLNAEEEEEEEEERGAHLSACHSRKVFSGLRGARAKTCRLQPGDQGAYNVKPESLETLYFKERVE